MSRPNSASWPGRLLIYGGVVAVIFIMGVLFGLIILSQWVTPSQPEVVVATATPGATATIAAPTEPDLVEAACPPPPNTWTTYTVQAGDTLSALAARAGISVDQIMQVNCLTSSDLLPGQTLYLPALPTPTPCLISPPLNWGLYIIQTGNTLFNLAAERGIGIDEIMRVNCLSSPDISVGQQLYLPLLPTPTPSPTPLPSPTPPPLPLQPAPPQPQPISPPSDQPITPQQPAPADGSAVAIAQAPVVVSQQSSFNSTTNLEPIRFATFKPNSLTPCKSAPISTLNVSQPWVDFYQGLEREAILKAQQQGEPYRYEVFPGQRIPIFACNFPEPDTLEARITHENGNQWPLGEGLYLPLGSSHILTSAIKGAVYWNIMCDLPQGEYTLTVQHRHYTDIAKTVSVTNTLTGRFLLKEPPPEQAGRKRVLVVPQAARTGGYFETNYCNYEPNESVPVTLYRAEWLGPERKWVPVDTWTITTNRKGWAKPFLRSLSNDPPGLYAIEASQGKFESLDTFWLFQ